MEKDGKVTDAILDYEQAKRFAAYDDWQPKLRAAIAKKSESSYPLHLIYLLLLQEKVVSSLFYLPYPYPFSRFPPSFIYSLQIHQPTSPLTLRKQNDLKVLFDRYPGLKEATASILGHKTQS